MPTDVTQKRWGFIKRRQGYGGHADPNKNDPYLGELPPFEPTTPGVGLDAIPPEDVEYHLRVFDPPGSEGYRVTLHHETSLEEWKNHFKEQGIKFKEEV